MSISKDFARMRRKTRISATITTSSDRPRLSVFRSNASIYAQIIDQAGVVLASASDLQFKEMTGTKSEKAKQVGQKIAELAKGKGISKIVFDRNGFLYHGRVKALADGARDA
ncbi:MAG: 50S ribosomal protein L18 [Patescibacteria group bacterium]|nr:50S ribosomal protein L18 [Patescibacteria group bacterium]